LDVCTGTIVYRRYPCQTWSRH